MVPPPVTYKSASTKAQYFYWVLKIKWECVWRTLWVPRWSTEQGRTACCVATTVTFVYVTSNDGSRPRAETLKDRHAVNPQNSMERNWHFKAGLGQVLVECRVDSARKRTTFASLNFTHVSSEETIGDLVAETGRLVSCEWLQSAQSARN